MAGSLNSQRGFPGSSNLSLGAVTGLGRVGGLAMGHAPGTASSASSGASRQAEILAKYQDKIKKKIDENPQLAEEMAKRVAEREAEEKALKIQLEMEEENKRKAEAATGEEKRRRVSLSDFMNVDVLAKFPLDKILAFWKEYNLHHENISAIINPAKTTLFLERSKTFPNFAVPLVQGFNDKEQKAGITLFFSAHFEPSLDSWFFAPIVSSSNIPSASRSASSSLSAFRVALHMDLLASHGVTLVQGIINHHANSLPSSDTFESSSNSSPLAGVLPLRLQDAAFLLQMLQLFYLTSDSAFEIVKDFNQSPSTFDPNRILTEMSALLSSSFYLPVAASSSSSSSPPRSATPTTPHFHY